MAEHQRRGWERDEMEKGEIDANQGKKSKRETRTIKFKVNTFIHFINYNIIHTYVHIKQSVILIVFNHCDSL